jgi:hypothetical protein
MKVTVEDERVFPTIGVIAQAGDTLEVPHEDDNKKSIKPVKQDEKKDEEA